MIKKCVFFQLNGLKFKGMKNTPCFILYHEIDLVLQMPSSNIYDIYVATPFFRYACSIQQLLTAFNSF